MTTGQLQDLVSEKARLFEQVRSATDEQTQLRLHKRITDITTTIDRDRVERLEDEERTAVRSAEAIAYGGASNATAGPSDQQFRDLAHGLIDHVDVPQEKRVTSIVDTGTGGNAFGGYGVPTSLYGMVWEHRVLTTPILPYCTVLQTGGGETLNIPTTTTDPVASAVDEGAQIGGGIGTYPVFGQLPLGSFKFGELIPVSTEVLQDAAIDLSGIIARLAGRSIGTATGEQFIQGDGTTEPGGLVTGASAGKTFAAVDTVTLDELKALYYSVGPLYPKRPHVRLGRLGRPRPSHEYLEGRVRPVLLGAQRQGRRARHLHGPGGADRSPYRRARALG